MAAATAEIERLQADNLRLKAALERIVKAHPFAPKSQLREDAETALRGSV
jgi:hypothetical protein